MAVRVLFLAANPADTDQLRLSNEVRTIDARLRQGDVGREMTVSSYWAVRATDLSEALMRAKPHIVHFSGHGSVGGIAVEDHLGNAKVLAKDAVAELFHILRDEIQCVVFNACFAREQAEAVAEHIGAVVGTTASITDEGAVAFAAGFYRALSYGRTIREAFELGRNEAALLGLPDDATSYQLVQGPDVALDQPIKDPGHERTAVEQQATEAGESGSEEAGRPALRVAFEVGDIREFRGDVVALKLANAFHGADAAVAEALGWVVDPTIPEWQHQAYEGGGAIGATIALFVGVPTLGSFSYAEIRRLATTTLVSLAEVSPTAQTVATTIHGVGIGLDEAEALKSQIAGYIEAVHDGTVSPNLTQVTIVDRSEQRIKRLSGVLEELAVDSEFITRLGRREFGILGRVRKGRHGAVIPPRIWADEDLPRAGIGSDLRKHVFVAMPFAEEWDDVFIYGIQQPAHAAGFICERMDKTAFTGDILERIKARIESALVVVAEITEPNPNVFLEIGYAWGKGRPTIFAAKEGAQPPFDVRNQKRVTYKRIHDLSEALGAELRAIAED